MRFNLFNSRDLRQLITELSAGLQRLDFQNNFESFEISAIIPDQTEISGDYRIDNRLKPNIPSGMLIVKQKGNALVTAGDTEWTSEYIYIKNNSTSIDANVKIKFFK
jgi:hypothetical protein